MKRCKLYKYLSYCAVIAAFISPLRLVAQQEYEPPSSPELYDTEDISPVVKNPKTKAHAYWGPSLGFGQSRPAGKSGLDTAWNLNVTGGFVRPTTNWSRIDLGLDVFFGELGETENHFIVYLGSMAHFGYGYNMAPGVQALLRAGVGVALSGYEGDNSEGNNQKSTSPILGTVFGVAGQAIVHVSDKMDVIAGLFLNQYAFTVSEVEVFDASGESTGEININQLFLYNSTEVKLGMRYHLN